MNTNIFHKAFGLVAGLAATAAVASTPTASDSLSAPLRVEADGKPIDVDVGHAAPLVADFDGDGNFDLLVGQFGDGKLRIYRNQGDNKNPKFGAFAYFKAGGSDGKVPAG